MLVGNMTVDELIPQMIKVSHKGVSPPSHGSMLIHTCETHVLPFV
jgi:hypothetical protein